MNKFALAAALALAFSGAAHGKVIELIAEPPAGATSAQQAGQAPLILPSNLSELPEPEVFAMMLVGLILIGYRSRRESSEKFK